MTITVKDEQGNVVFQQRDEQTRRDKTDEASSHNSVEDDDARWRDVPGGKKPPAFP